MSDNKPVADLLAIVERPNDRRSSDFVTVGALWLTERGHLMGKMHSEPLAWADRNQARQVMVRLRDGFQIVRGSGAVSSKSWASGSRELAEQIRDHNARQPTHEPELPPEDDIPFDDDGLGSPA